MGNRFPTGPRRVTISDVADLAGVSKGTVSKFLGGGDYYTSQDTRTKIAAAVAELDFQPNAIAQGLVRRRTQTVGVIVASVVNPLYAELLDGIDEVLGANNFTLIIGSSEGLAEKETAVVRSMRQRQVDGIIMASVTMGDNEVQNLVESGLDVVLASRNLMSTHVDTVRSDNIGGAMAAVEHLVEHGHVRIGHLAGPQMVAPFVDRRTAYDKVIGDHGLDADPRLTVEVATPRREDAADAMAVLLALEDPPTAVFVASDGMALGALEACDRLGVTVPDDLAVVGFDNVWVSRMPGIRLTTVDGAARQIGVRAAQTLLARIEARWDRAAGAQVPRLEVLPTRLVRGATCGCSADQWDS